MPYTIPEYIEIKATDGSTVAFLSPESDGVVAWIDDEQNGSCTIEIELPLSPLSEEVVEYEQVQVGEEIVGWEYGEDITSGKTYSADSEYSADCSPDKAFDNDEVTFWRSSSGGVFPHWIQVDMIVAKTIKKLRLKPYEDWGTFVRDFKLQGSNDGNTWVDIYTDVAVNNGNWQEFVFDNNTSYRFYRVYGTNNYNSWLPNDMGIREIEMMEVTPVYEPIYEQKAIYQYVPHPKWQYLTDKYRIYAGDKEFVILNPDAVDKQRDGKKLTGKIKAHESWVLLGKKYQTISNDPQNPSPPWGAVIIVSGGAAHGGFDPGSAGSALSYLLQGTGWTVGTVDVTGTYDLETEKESVLYNINQVQEKWGGILVWDSVNHTVSLRDEETWQNYTGYQIRYAKNLKGISRVDDYDIVTRLYPFGENDLNISAVNGGLLYLDNQSYSTEVLEGVWYNQDIADQAQLKTQGEKQLAVMCRPRHNYKTEVLDLRSLPGYGHETFARSDMVDLFDEEFGANARVRIIRYRHNVFQPWLCDMELGDPIEKIQATVAQTVLMAKFYKNVVAPNTSFQNLLKAIINTAATEINGASGDYTLVDGVSTWFDRDEVTGELTGKLLRITPQGLIISYDGGQTWKLAISGEGIHADAGWVGKLNAGVITVGADTTFESGYDPSKIVAGSTVGMGVDSDCLGLWHFDGSLNSHKGVAVDSDGAFGDGCFGQALNIATGKHLKVPTTNMLATLGSINFRAKNLSASPNGAVLVDLPKSDNSQGIKAGIANDGKLYISDSDKVSKNYIETTQADFQSGALTDVVATSTGDLELKQEKFIDNCASVSGWTAGGEGTPASDGNSFYASSFGSGASWHGPSLTKALGFIANDLTCVFDITWLNDIVAAFGHVQISLLDATEGEVAFISMTDAWRASLNTILVARAGSSDIFNTGSGSTAYNNYSGAFKLSRSGSTWTFHAGNNLLGTLTGGTITAVTQIKLTFWRYGTEAVVTTMKVNDINIITPYKASGTRIKEVNLSGANPAGGTKIEWSKTTPTNTTVKVETALSTDGGSTYGAYQEATSGSSIPGITAQIDLSNARLKIKETLSTTDTTKTPQLHSLSFTIIESAGATSYGPNKSTLTGWDSISLAWKSDRLSLVVNDTEACYIENPGLPAALGSHVFIGTDRNGANAINTLVDELRIDKVYRDADVRTGWHKTGVPFYTSEDMKQWPGYLRAETDGLKVYDSSNALRVLLGSWLEGAVREYGLETMKGRIYSSIIRSGDKDAKTYVQLTPPNKLQVFSESAGGDSLLELEITAYTGARGGSVAFYYNGAWYGQISANSSGILVSSPVGKINLWGYNGTEIASNLHVSGNLTCSGSKPARQVTKNYGLRYMYATESPEIVYYDRGVANLVNGEATVYLDPIYLECIEPDTDLTPWQIWVQCYGENDVYVSEVGSNYIKIKERNNGTSNNKVVWKHEAIRNGYAGIRLMEVTD